MILLLSLSYAFTVSGGQISVIATDFVQGFFTAVVFIATVAYLWLHFDYTTVGEALVAASNWQDDDGVVLANGKSKFNPYDIAEVDGFNMFFYLSNYWLTVYTCMAWQGDQGYNSAAESAHAAKMSGVIQRLRMQLQNLAMLLLPAAALIILNLPQFADVRDGIESQISQLAVEDTAYLSPKLVGQQKVPITLAHVLPAGLRGAFAAAMLGFFISTHTTYLHTWGSILIQDVIIPLRGEAESPEEHIRWLRLSILLVTVLVFLWSWLVPTLDFIFMFMALSGTIWQGGAGTCIIGGLYWAKGNANGAWAGLAVGASLGIGGIIASVYCTEYDRLSWADPIITLPDPPRA